jgi:hypothetical protein
MLKACKFKPENRVTLACVLDFYISEFDLYLTQNPLNSQLISDKDLIGALPYFKIGLDQTKLNSIYKALDLSIADLETFSFKPASIALALIYLELGIHYNIFSKVSLSSSCANFEILQKITDQLL